MRTEVRLLAALAVALPVLSGAPARADGDCRGISRAEAISIARSAGVARVTEVECDDGRWEVEGRDQRGREIEVKIDPRTGQVLKVERD